MSDDKEEKQRARAVRAMSPQDFNIDLIIMRQYKFTPLMHKLRKRQYKTTKKAFRLEQYPEE